MKQTSIEWLIEQLKINGSGAVKTFPELFEQVKLLHKQEIIDAYDKNKMGRVNYGEQYYQETFKKD